MSRISIFGYYGQDNAGDEAILSAIIAGIKCVSPHSKIAAYSGKPQETKQNHNIAAFAFFSLSLKAIVKGTLGRNRVRYWKSVFNFLRTDLVIIGGGGLYFDTQETNRWIFGYINLIHMAKFFRKKVVLFGISVGPLHHQESKDAIAKAFIHADLISVRDHLSKELLSSLGIPPQKVHVIPDLVFTFNSAPQETISRILADEGIPNDKKILALVPCCYNTSKVGWLEQYIHLCEQINAEHDVTLLLVPFQRHNTFDDLSAAQSIYDHLNESAKKSTFLLKKNYSPAEIQGVLSTAKFVFAERLHGSIMALNTNTPFLGIAYMQKVSGVLELANLPDRIIPIDEFLNGNFLTNAKSTIKSVLEELISPHELNKGIREKAYKNFELLKNLI
jgi:polysaccharide pyruvyl transferase CsaB